MRLMNILMIAGEVQPYAKTGGLGGHGRITEGRAPAGTRRASIHAAVWLD